MSAPPFAKPKTAYFNAHFSATSAATAIRHFSHSVKDWMGSVLRAIAAAFKCVVRLLSFRSAPVSDMSLAPDSRAQETALTTGEMLGGEDGAEAPALQAVSAQIEGQPEDVERCLGAMREFVLSVERGEQTCPDDALSRHGWSRVALAQHARNAVTMEAAVMAAIAQAEVGLQELVDQGFAPNVPAARVALESAPRLPHLEKARAQVAFVERMMEVHAQQIKSVERAFSYLSEPQVLGCFHEVYAAVQAEHLRMLPIVPERTTSPLYSLYPLDTIEHWLSRKTQEVDATLKDEAHATIQEASAPAPAPSAVAPHLQLVSDAAATPQSAPQHDGAERIGADFMEENASTGPRLVM
ncbi:MAG: hypothetical protein KGL39_21550 [Patescibacteria group bacterium]|nr:hypothetical protein [Patescibacteria group bacterium]